MPKPTSEFMSLFRSIKPDDTDFQTIKSATADEAAQRWPLFKALPPEKPEPTPPLSEQDRARWDNQETPGIRVRQSALSVPTTTPDMAASLKRMAGIQPSPKTASAHVPPIVSTKINHKSKKLPSSAPTPTLTQPTAQHLTSEVVPTNLSSDIVESVHDKLLKGHGALSQAPVIAQPEPMTSTNSLASIFSRLEGKNETCAKPSTPISSFFGRLGRR